MERLKMLDDLYRFSTYISFIDMSFNQYLLLGEEPVLVHTGSADQTEAMIPMLKETLGGKKLPYVFISHFESDECGGLALLKEHFPKVKPICSQVTARQLSGFSIAGEAIIKKPGDSMEMGGKKFIFISYPSEMHLWEGLLAFEENRGLFFSSDLLSRMGKIGEEAQKSTWQNEIQSISLQKIPSPSALKSLQENLAGLSAKMILPGHGPFIKIVS